MRKILYGLIVVVMAVVVYEYGVKNRGGLQLSPSKVITGQGLSAPGFEKGGEWLGSEVLDLDQMMSENKVVLVDFWTYSCVNCQRTVPHLKQWWESYGDNGLVIVGVHSPEFEFEKDKENVLAAMEKYGVTWPVVQDNEMKIWMAYSNRYWPAKYLIVPPNKEIVYTHFGEGKYEETEQVIRTELAKAGYELGEKANSSDASNRILISQSPETYLGWLRGMFADRAAIKPGQMVRYSAPEKIMMNQTYLSGSWKVEDEYSEAGEGAEIKYKFRAGEVNLVMGGSGGKVMVYVDDKLVQEVNVREHDLYQLYKGGVVDGELRLLVEPGIRVYAFTFGG